MNTLEKRKILQPFFTECAQKGYNFGDLDCVNFASKAVSLLIGRDINQEMGWDPMNKLEAMRIVVEAGGIEPLMEAVASKFNFTRIENPNLAQFGDAVYSPRLNSIGIVESSVLYITSNGLARVNIEPDMIVYRPC